MPKKPHFHDKETELRVFGKRVLVSAAGVLLLAALLVARYFQLQVLDHETYRTESDRNRIHVQVVPPRRGLIFDRNGVLLADNRPIFNLYVTRERVTDVDAMLRDVGAVIELGEEDVRRFRDALRRSLPFQPVALRFNLSEAEIARLAVERYRLPGVEVEADLVRHYPHRELLGHVLGYVSRINEQELEAFTEQERANYSGTNLIGKSGVEKFYETELHGKVGYENVETNARGRVLRVLEHFDPEPGSDLVLELDIAVQRAAYEALEGERGAAVAIDPRNGAVIALASTPSYDPNPFVSGIGYRAYAELRDSPDRPLLNRAIQGQYPPGSTLKPMYALAGLAYGVNTPQSAVSDPGWYRIGGGGRRYRDWKKWGHGGAVSLDQAITESCDVYFYDLAHRLGIDRLHDFSVQFGLGAPTGVDQTSERAGVMPSTAWKRKALGQPWYPGENLSAGIGQGYVLATPMQLALMTATIASRGTVFQPRLLARAGNRPRQPVRQREVALRDPDQWQAVLTAMEHVVHGPRGTAKIIAQDIAYRAAGKTGTAQVISVAENETYDASKLDKRQRDHALFIGFAPVDDPRIAVAVIVENGEHGSSAAAPVARRIFDAYLLQQETVPGEAPKPAGQAPTRLLATGF